MRPTPAAAPVAARRPPPNVPQHWRHNARQEDEGAGCWPGDNLIRNTKLYLIHHNLRYFLLLYCSNYPSLQIFQCKFPPQVGTSCKGVQAEHVARRSDPQHRAIRPPKTKTHFRLPKKKQKPRACPWEAAPPPLDPTRATRFALSGRRGEASFAGAHAAMGDRPRFLRPLQQGGIGRE